MKKMSIILIIFALCSLLIGGVFFLTKSFSEKNSPKEKEEKVSVVPGNQLSKSLAEIADDLYRKENYDKCILEEGRCFLSLDSLEKDYGYDISLFTGKGANCSRTKSGIYFSTVRDDSAPYTVEFMKCEFLVEVEQKDGIGRPDGLPDDAVLIEKND